MKNKGFSDDARLVAVVSNWQTDLASVPEARKLMGGPIPKAVIEFYESMHFDNLATTAAVEKHWEYVEKTMNNVIDLAKQGQEPIENYLGYLGVILHAVQDFYAHSNWVDLWKEGAKRGDGDVPTWDDAAKDRHSFPMLDKICTGAWGTKPAEGQPTHDDLNKDSKNRKYHDAAVMTAALATEQWIDKFLARVNDKDIVARLKSPTLPGNLKKHYKGMYDRAKDAALAVKKY